MADQNRDNLLANPGFEETADDGLADWTLKLSKGVYFRRESTPPVDYGPCWPLDTHSGGDAIRFATLRGGAVECFQEVGITGGRRCEASVWVKTYDADGQGFGARPGDMAGIRLDFLDSVGKVISKRLVASLTRATQGYCRLAGRCAVPKGAVRARFSLVAKIGCNHWHGCVRFDDCALEEID